MATLETLFEKLRRLGDAAKVAEDAATDAREARDAAIEEGDRAGLSVRQIAALTGLSRPRVQAVVVARTAARHARLYGPTDV